MYSNSGVGPGQLCFKETSDGSSDAHSGSQTWFLHSLKSACSFCSESLWVCPSNISINTILTGLRGGSSASWLLWGVFLRNSLNGIKGKMEYLVTKRPYIVLVLTIMATWLQISTAFVKDRAKAELPWKADTARDGAAGETGLNTLSPSPKRKKSWLSWTKGNTRTKDTLWLLRKCAHLELGASDLEESSPALTSFSRWNGGPRRW